MAYCTKEDVIGELHPTLKLHMSGHYDQLHAADPAQPDFSRFLTEHIAKAEACANASLARAYRVPLKKATGIVTSAVCKIAAYFSAAAFAEKEAILKDKYETAMLMLDNLVKANDPKLVDEEPDKLVTFAGYGSNPRIFTDEELARW